MSQCKIYLENYGGTYYAGSEIRGRLECYFDDEVSVRGIKIRGKCREYNEWTASEEYRDAADNNKLKTRFVQYVGDREVLSYERMLFGGTSGTRNISRGRHVYPFTLTLPEDIPSTFNGPHGSISYWIKGIVDRPMRTDYEDKFIIVVQSPIDFNKKSKDLQKDANYSDEKTVCCWCCAGGNITMDVLLPKIAFVVGETVDFQVKITNLTNTNVDELKIKMKKKVTYKVTSPSNETKVDEDEVLRMVEHGVGAHGEHTYDLKLEIPAHLEVPNFSQCHYFTCEFVLEFVAVMDGCTMDLEMNVYPELGHIQYNGGQTTVPPLSSGGIGFTHHDIPPMDGVYPPPLPSPYPPPMYPPAPYPPTPGYPPPSAAPGYPPMPHKPMYPGGEPSAPTSSNANAPLLPDDGNPKAREAAGYPPTAPAAAQSSAELPPPSYSQVQQGMYNPPYPPQ